MSNSGGALESAAQFGGRLAHVLPPHLRQSVKHSRWCAQFLVPLRDPAKPWCAPPAFAVQHVMYCAWIPLLTKTIPRSHPKDLQRTSSKQMRAVKKDHPKATLAVGCAKTALLELRIPVPGTVFWLLASSGSWSAFSLCQYSADPAKRLNRIGPASSHSCTCAAPRRLTRRVHARAKVS